MGKYEDEDGIDGPFNRAMAASIREDAARVAEVPKAPCARCHRTRVLRVAPTDALAALHGDAPRCGSCWIALGDAAERAETIRVRETGLGRCEAFRHGLRCDQIAGHPDTHNFAHERAKRIAARAAAAPRTDADALELRVAARVSLAVEPLRAQVEEVMASVAKLTARLDGRHS